MQHSIRCLKIAWTLGTARSGHGALAGELVLAPFRANYPDLHLAAGQSINRISEFALVNSSLVVIFDPSHEHVAQSDGDTDLALRELARISERQGAIAH